MTYKAVIADDEKELRGYLKAMLAETWPELTICAEAANGREALEMIDACLAAYYFSGYQNAGSFRSGCGPKNR